MKSFFKLTSAFFTGEDKRYAIWAGLLLLMLSLSLVGFGYFFTQWNGRFYDALGQKNIELFFKESLVFCGLIIAYGIFLSFTRYHGQQYALRWRLWMSHKGLDLWLPTRMNIEGSDQRIQEDLMRFTNIFERFFLECFNSVIVIMLFIPMLYRLTSKMTFFYDLNLATVLVIAIIAYTLIGLYVSTKIANPLIKMEYNNQKTEADFRYKLVHARDGEDISQSVFSGVIKQLNESYSQIYKLKKNFSLWQQTYDQASFLLPFLLIGSNYFSGAITLGALMQIRSTFSRIRNAMSYLLDHYAEVTELCAISIRLLEFYQAIKFFEENNTSDLKDNLTI